MNRERKIIWTSQNELYRVVEIKTRQTGEALWGSQWFMEIKCADAMGHDSWRQASSPKNPDAAADLIAGGKYL